MSDQKPALKSRSPGRSVERCPGVWGRSLAARPKHLLLHPEEFNRASKEDVQALAQYVKEERWKSLYHVDRRMYKLLKAGAHALKDRLNIPPPPRPSSLDNLRCVLEVTRDLRDGTGKLSVTKIAHLFGIKPNRLAQWLGQTSSVLTCNPTAGFLQHGLMYFERISWLRIVLNDEAFRRWLRCPNPNLGNQAPLDWLDDGRLQNIVDLVHDMLTGAPT